MSSDGLLFRKCNQLLKFNNEKTKRMKFKSCAKALFLQVRWLGMVAHTVILTLRSQRQDCSKDNLVYIVGSRPAKAT